MAIKISASALRRKPASAKPAKKIYSKSSKPQTHAKGKYQNKKNFKHKNSKRKNFKKKPQAKVFNFEKFKPQGEQYVLIGCFLRSHYKETPQGKQNKYWVYPKMYNFIIDDSMRKFIGKQTAVVITNKSQVSPATGESKPTHSVLVIAGIRKASTADIEQHTYLPLYKDFILNDDAKAAIDKFTAAYMQRNQA